MPPAKSDCDIPIQTKLPLKVPYRTGSYLIYDYVTSDKAVKQPSGCPPINENKAHFREGSGIGLRASGSR